ncbi:hypothetical protein P8452_64362 [Trifolium repens]|nr:hypothetical protein P8452_64362 [Trifolium repens]
MDMVGERKKLVEEGKVRHIWLSGASLEGSLWTRNIEDEIVPLLTSHPSASKMRTWMRTKTHDWIESIGNKHGYSNKFRVLCLFMFTDQICEDLYTVSSEAYFLYRRVI